MEHASECRQAFLQLSARLTGFEVVELLGTGMTEVYHQQVVRHGGRLAGRENWSALRDEWHLLVLRANGDQAVLGELIGLRLMAPGAFGDLARKITALWYLGMWYDDITNPSSGAMLNGQAYQQALVWVTAEAHPPGAKQPGFGSWSRPPIRIPQH